MREAESAGVGEEGDVEEEVEREDEGEYFARYEAHKKRGEGWEVTTVKDLVK